jgi:5-formyltetrahydrofolate cyclo-ligase
LSELEPGYFGVPEPVDKCPEVDTGDIDLVIMPGIAFDREGGRIGYGGGFYDRFLIKMERKVDRIAPAYDFQVVDEVPVDLWDIRIDGIITNREIINVNHI